MGGPPQIKLDLKHKTSDRRVDFISLWRSDNGHPGSYQGKASLYDAATKTRDEVESIRTKSGKVIKLDEWWVNATHWPERNGDGGGGGGAYDEGEPDVPFGAAPGNPADDDIPFIYQERIV